MENEGYTQRAQTEGGRQRDGAGHWATVPDTGHPAAVRATLRADLDQGDPTERE